MEEREKGRETEAETEGESAGVQNLEFNFGCWSLGAFTVLFSFSLALTL